MFRKVMLAALFAAVPASVLADDFQLTVENFYTDAMTGMSVSGGKVANFKRVPANGTRVFTVTLPDGACAARISVTFANGYAYHDNEKFDFCQYDIYGFNWIE